MKIADVKSYILEAPMPTPWFVAHQVLYKAYTVLVEVVTDEGISGTGEAMTRLGPGVTKSIIDEVLKPCIMGHDPMAIEALWGKMFNLLRFRGHSRGYFIEAISGVDIALWDIAGKALKLPIYRLMMGCNRPEIPVYASSVFWDTPANMAKAAVNLVGKGYHAVKVKLGQGVEADAPCIKAIRQAVGPEIELMADVNSAYNCTDAIRMGRKLEEADFRWLEEPVQPDDLDGYRTVSAKLDIAVASGEGEFTEFGIRSLIENGVRIIQPDVGRAGGITGVRRIATLAQAFHVPFAAHTGASSAVSIAATLHLAATVPNFLTYEHMVAGNPLLESLTTEPMPVPRNSVMAIPQGPGLGIELDPKALAKFRVS